MTCIGTGHFTRSQTFYHNKSIRSLGKGPELLKRSVSLIILSLLVASVLAVVSNVQLVKSDYTWTQTIWINADGSISPSAAPISSVDNVTYTLTDNIVGNVTANSEAIIIVRDNIIIDGSGYTLQGTKTSPSWGILLTGVSNVTIKNMIITAFDYGIELIGSSNNSVSGNNITANTNNGINFYSSSNNSVSGNNVTANNGDGIGLYDSSHNNSVSGNNITANNYYGMELDFSYNNSVSGNDITANSWGIYLGSSSDNSMDRNNITNNWAGINLYYSSNNSVSGNNIANIDIGIELDGSSNNSLSGNNVTANNEWGIELDGSSNNSVSGNSFVKDGLRVADSYGNVVTGNLVNSKPLVYLEGVSDYAVGDAGQVILINCYNVTVDNLNLSNTTIGVELLGTNDTTISGNNITANSRDGIYLESSSNNSVSENNVTANNERGIYVGEGKAGIYLKSSSNNSVSGNNVTANNGWGIYLDFSNYNTVSGNNVKANIYDCIEVLACYDNMIYHNNFINNTSSQYGSGETNVWDDGYPSGGNYWSNYNGTDSNSDGIGDAPYVTDQANNTDHYPLMGMFYDFNVSYIAPGFNVELISNSSVSAFAVGSSIENPNSRLIDFNVGGETGTEGFCRICIPTALLNASYTVLLNGTQIPSILLPFSNSTHSYLYFNYTHSTEMVIITPEFPSLLILPLFMIAALLAVVVYKRKHISQPARA
jgi:parallel beta-helix repeat protein